MTSAITRVRTEIIPGMSVVNVGRKDHRLDGLSPLHRATLGSEIGLVVDRPELPLPLFEGLAVWVRYIDRMEFLQLTPVEDLKIMVFGSPDAPAGSFG